MKKSQLIFAGVSIFLITAALLGTPLAAIYLAVSPVKLAPYLLYPLKRDKSYQDIDLKPFGTAGEIVEIPIPNGGHLCGFYFPRPNAPYTVLISHGQGPLKNQMGLSHAALASNQNVLIYDYEGYGKSSGEPSTGNLQNDGLAAFDYLVKKKNISANRIINMGASLGTGIASHIALYRDCAAVLLVSPYNSLAQAARDNIDFFKLYPASLYPQPDLSCLPLMRSAKSEPIAIIHGALDQRIPVRHSQQLVTAYKLHHEKLTELNQSQTASSAQLGSSKLHYVELPNCHHGDIPLQTITDEINTIVSRLESPKALLSTTQNRSNH